MMGDIITAVPKVICIGEAMITVFIWTGHILTGAL
jgi:hypothetical protein